MARRPVIVFLLKIIPLFVLFLVTWHTLGLSRVYHSALAGPVGWIYPRIDRSGTVRGVALQDGQFVFKLVIAGKRTGGSANAEDITSNMALLLTLFLASPIRGRLRSFLIHISSAVIILFFVHAFTLMALCTENLMHHRGVMRNNPFSNFEMFLIPRYSVFYEELGMYLIVLVLWFPYIVRCIRDTDPGNGQNA